MGVFKMDYVIEKRKNGRLYRYWQPKSRYFVAGKWKKCPFKPQRLGDDWVLKADELNKALKKWRDGFGPTVRFEQGSVGWLIGQYLKDEAFDKLEKNTKTKYRGCLKILQEKLGDLPADKITRMGARTFCMALTSASSAPSRMSATCRVLYNFGRNIGAVNENPFDDMRLSRTKPRTSVWPVELVERVKENAIKLNMPSIALAIQLALDTGQRAGDLRTLTWASYKSGKLHFKQNKTGAVVHIPAMKTLQIMLDLAERFSPSILVCEATKKPYNKDMLSRRFRDACEGIEGAEALQFRDLRRTAVVRLAEYGCTNSEIAAITGHSLNATTNILEVYLPRTSKMAENAITKLESKLEPRTTQHVFGVGTND